MWFLHDHWPAWCKVYPKLLKFCLDVYFNFGPTPPYFFSKSWSLWVILYTVSLPELEYLLSSIVSHLFVYWSLSCFFFCLIPTGNMMKVLRGHQNWVYCCAFSPDSSILCSVGAGKAVGVTFLNFIFFFWILQNENSNLRISLCSVSSSDLAFERMIKVWW